MRQQRIKPVRVGACLDASDLTILFNTQKAVERAEGCMRPIRREIAVKDLIEKLMEMSGQRDLLPQNPSQFSAKSRLIRVCICDRLFQVEQCFDGGRAGEFKRLSCEGSLGVMTRFDHLIKK